VELWHILDEEELHWYKRCHEKWLLEGDNNTKFFHKVANGRKRQHAIFSLQDGANVITGNENLLKHATTYYKALFGPGEGDAFNLDQALWPEDQLVSSLENESLAYVFKEEEVKGALFQMEANKAAGSDGFPIEFFSS
jgi:hypothetical protein